MPKTTKQKGTHRKDSKPNPKSSKQSKFYQHSSWSATRLSLSQAAGIPNSGFKSYRNHIVAEVELNVQHIACLHAGRPVCGECLLHVLIQLVMINLETVTSIIQKPYENHIDLEWHRKWNLNTPISEQPQSTANYGSHLLSKEFHKKQQPKK